MGLWRQTTPPKVIADVMKVVFKGLLIPTTLYQVITEVMDVGQL